MSRSRKKNPYISNTCRGDRTGMMKDWKRECNRNIRRISLDEEMPKNNLYKKMNNPWLAPNDGKHYWDDPKGYRK